MWVTCPSGALTFGFPPKAAPLRRHKHYRAARCARPCEEGYSTRRRASAALEALGKPQCRGERTVRPERGSSIQWFVGSRDLLLSRRGDSWTGEPRRVIRVIGISISLTMDGCSTDQSLTETTDQSTPRTFFPFLQPQVPAQTSPRDVSSWPNTNAHILPSLHCSLSLQTFVTSDPALAPSSDRARLPASISLSGGHGRNSSSRSGSASNELPSLPVTSISPHQQILQSAGIDETMDSVIPNSEGEEEGIDALEQPDSYSLPGYITIHRPDPKPAQVGASRPAVLVPATATETSCIRDFSERKTTAESSSRPTGATASRSEDIGTFGSRAGGSKGSSAASGPSGASKAPAQAKQRMRAPRISSQKARDAREELRQMAESASVDVNDQTVVAQGGPSLDQNTLDPVLPKAGSSSTTAVKSLPSKKRTRGKDPLVPSEDQDVAAALASTSRGSRSKATSLKAAKQPGTEDVDRSSSARPTKAEVSKKAKGRQTAIQSDDEAEGEASSEEEVRRTANGAGRRKRDVTNGAKPAKDKHKESAKSAATKRARNFQVAEAFKSSEMVDSDDEETILVPARRLSVASKSQRSPLAAVEESEASGEETEPVRQKGKQPMKKQARRSEPGSSPAPARQSAPPETPATGPFDLTTGRASRSKTRSAVAPSAAKSSSQAQETPATDDRRKKRKVIDSDDEDDTTVAAASTGQGLAPTKSGKTGVASKLVSCLKLVMPKAPPHKKAKLAPQKEDEERNTENDEDEEEKEGGGPSAGPGKARPKFGSENTYTDYKTRAGKRHPGFANGQVSCEASARSEVDRCESRSSETRSCGRLGQVRPWRCPSLGPDAREAPSAPQHQPGAQGAEARAAEAEQEAGRVRFGRGGGEAGHGQRRRGQRARRRCQTQPGP